MIDFYLYLETLGLVLRHIQQQGQNIPLEGNQNISKSC